MIEFLLDNIIFVAVVVFGIFRLLSSGLNKNNNEEEQRNRPVQTARPEQTTHRRTETSTESSPTDLFGELKGLFQEMTNPEQNSPKTEPVRKVETVKDEVEVATSEMMSTAANTHEEQMEKWRKRYEKSSEKPKVSHQLVGDLRGSIEDEGKYSEGVEDTDIRKHLTRRGLQESYVMAEILGSPRAFKPHQSSYRRRNI